MSVTVLKKTEEPEHGGGDDGGEEVPCAACEWCGEDEFKLVIWRDMSIAICTACHMPQVSIIWGYTNEA